MIQSRNRRQHQLSHLLRPQIHLPRERTFKGRSSTSIRRRRTGKEFLAFSTATGLSRYTDIPWPEGLAPKTGKRPAGVSAAPCHAPTCGRDLDGRRRSCAQPRLTPGKDSRNDYRLTRTTSRPFRKDATRLPRPPGETAWAYWTTTIGGKKVVVFKSDSHMSQDGPQLPNIDVWMQIIEEVQPRLVITTGTAGGIGKQFEVGDVIVSPIVRFDCTSEVQERALHSGSLFEQSAETNILWRARNAFQGERRAAAQGQHAAAQYRRVAPTRLASSVVTTDFFGFDTSDDHYHLQGLGDVSEMGDAVLGLVASDGANAPRWVAVRNVSDPQIKADGYAEAAGRHRRRRSTKGSAAGARFAARSSAGR